MKTSLHIKTHYFRFGKRKLLFLNGPCFPPPLLLRGNFFTTSPMLWLAMICQFELFQASSDLPARPGLNWIESEIKILFVRVMLTFILLDRGKYGGGGNMLSTLLQYFMWNENVMITGGKKSWGLFFFLITWISLYVCLCVCLYVCLYVCLSHFFYTIYRYTTKI